ncbi:ABC transporter ATP-binding protein [Polycladidibacter stylochi]|uniref:ABC transporter ATP-binding protein n=1 Tax=Polycladidibacter stylochi TaxID=1807766 RepID=UPI000AB8D260|nr:ABC transporter ATP-binding protein [Pseudovibrio stylochi]
MINTIGEVATDAHRGPVLRVQDLSIEFGDPRAPFCAVQKLSYSLDQGKTLAIVGESGSGKSVSSLALLGLIPHVGGRISQGTVLFDSPHYGHEVNINDLPEKALRILRGNEIAMIFQEPMTSLNPVYTVGSQIIEAIKLHSQKTTIEARREALEWLERVRLPHAKRIIDSYPHQLSGGMRQRAMIAMALSCRPKILIADEPTTALDVTIQAQILHIIRELQSELDMAVVFISHDMGVVSEMADDVLVMRQGLKVEYGDVKDVLVKPQHPYTKSLLAAVPRIGSMENKTLPERFDIVEDKQQRTDGPIYTAVAPKYENAPLLEVAGLTTRFNIRSGLLNKVTHHVHAAESVGFQLFKGETLGLVGESGSGKSTVGKTIQQLIDPVGGTVRFRGQDVFQLPKAQRKKFRQEIQYIFQDPYGSLNPRKKIGESIAEPIRTHGLLESKSAIEKRVKELLERVGLQSMHYDRYPHEFSGGQRQRICIARALACEPSLIIADEAVSALDVSVQAQVLNLMMDLQAEKGLSYLFISHDMAVIERVCHRVAVMYLGQLVELGPREQIFKNPQHPYTRRLLSAVPELNPSKKRESVPLEGEIPSAVRAVGDAPFVHGFDEVSPGHFLAQNAGNFRWV